jgi:hypothetical protein
LSERGFRARVVRLILSGNAEEALELLAEHYDVSVPVLRVGLPKGRKKNVLGCYTVKDTTIHVLNSDVFCNPFVILHEFYHHLRTVDKKHRGTERYANKFAHDFIQTYKSATRK